MNRHRRPLRTALVALLAVIVAGAVAHSTLLLFLLLAAGAVLAWRRRRTARPVRGRPEPAEVTRMRAQLDQAGAELDSAHRQVARLEQELADAQEGMHRGWDQAASVTPRPAPGPGADAAQQRLLSTPRSGVRPLFRDRP